MKRLILLLIPGLLFVFLVSCEEQEFTCSFTSHSNNDTIRNNEETKITVSTSQDVKKIEFYLDGSLIGAVISKPFTLRWTPENIEGGKHKLTCIAISKEDKEAQSEIDIVVKLKLGDKYKGGRIFYLDSTGNHGLIASLNDASINGDNTFFWGPHEVIGASNKENGKENTIKMANASSNSSYAGYIFKNGYELNGYDDWYIPAQEELKILQQNQEYVGNFPSQSDNASYWSSTELSKDKAFALNFIALMGTNVTKGHYGYRIRPIREF